MFCYCPLYHIPDCGGSYHILENGVKDCSACHRPHDPEFATIIFDTLYIPEVQQILYNRIKENYNDHSDEII